MDVNTAKAFLSSITMHELSSQETTHGIAWTGLLHRDGVPVLRVVQAGRGAGNTYLAPNHGRPDQQFIDELAQACMAFGLSEDDEPVDGITAAMDGEGTALDAVLILVDLDAEMGA